MPRQEIQKKSLSERSNRDYAYDSSDGALNEKAKKRIANNIDMDSEEDQRESRARANQGLVAYERKGWNEGEVDVNKVRGGGGGGGEEVGDEQDEEEQGEKNGMGSPVNEPVGAEEKGKASEHVSASQNRSSSAGPKKVPSSSHHTDSLEKKDVAEYAYEDSYDSRASPGPVVVAQNKKEKRCSPTVGMMGGGEGKNWSDMRVSPLQDRENSTLTLSSSRVDRERCEGEKNDTTPSDWKVSPRRSRHGGEDGVSKERSRPPRTQLIGARVDALTSSVGGGEQQEKEKGLSRTSLGGGTSGVDRDSKKELGRDSEFDEQQTPTQGSVRPSSRYEFFPLLFYQIDI
tara:strand:+ start:879 stop:1910 length:1032 start_codon:yes stop_codon:yes gene_type:complete